MVITIDQVYPEDTVFTKGKDVLFHAIYLEFVVRKDSFRGVLDDDTIRDLLFIFMSIYTKIHMYSWYIMHIIHVVCRLDLHVTRACR